MSTGPLDGITGGADADQTSSAVQISPPRPPTTQAMPDGAPLINLAGLLGAEDQKKIAETVCRDYDGDVKSREVRMKRIKEYYGLYASVMKPKNFPFQNAANVNLPVLTYPMLQVQGRLFDMLIPTSGKILTASPTNLGDVERAHNAETFANSYIRWRIPELQQGLDDTLSQMCLAGSAFRRTYWNAAEERICSDWIPLEDFVVMHTQRSQDPSMRDVPRYTLVQHLSYFDILDYGAAGVYVNTDKVKLETPEAPDGAESELVDQLHKIDGSEPTEEVSDEDKPRFVLEQYRKWRMPNKPKIHPAFDGRVHAVTATVDEMTSTLLSFVVREEPDPSDHSRFQQQKSGFDAHLKQLQSHVDGLAQNPNMLGPPPPPPMPPPGVKVDGSGIPVPPKPQRQRPVSFFTHFRAFPSEGFYGLGFGDFLAPLNRGINTLINQHIDGVTLRNAKPGFISRQLKGQRGTLDLRPGQLTEVDAPTGSLKDGIAWMDMPPNDPTTMPLVEMLIGLGDKLVASSDIMSGQSSGANRTAKETQILAEQAMMQITVLARRVIAAFRHELDKIWRLLNIFMPDSEIQEVLDDAGNPQPMQVSRDLFAPDAHVFPVADPRTKTQRVEENTAVYSFVTNNPFLMNGLPPPQRDALMLQVSENLLRALGAEQLARLIQPPPQPPGPPPPRPYWAEDADFLRGKDSQPNPADDDHEHLAGHMAALSSPAGAVMTKKSKDMAEQHIRNHHAQLIDKAGKAHEQEMAALHHMPMPGMTPPMQQQGAPPP